MNQSVLVNTMVWIENYRQKHPNIKPYMADPYTVQIIESPAINEEDIKVAWTDWFKRIHVRDYLFGTLDDNLRFQALAHELVHVAQYKNVFKMIWVRTFGRFFAEKEAYKLGEMAEQWIVAERAKELESMRHVELESIDDKN